MVLTEYDPQARLANYDPAHLLVEHVPNLPSPHRSTKERDMAGDLAKAFLIGLGVVKGIELISKSDEDDEKQHRWLTFTKVLVNKGWDQDAYERLVGGPFRSAFVANALPVLVMAADLGRREGHKEHFGRRTDTYGPATAAWAKAYADSMALQIERQSQAALREAANDLLNRRISAGALAELLEKMYGLDPRDAKAYANYTLNKVLPRGQSLPEMLRQMIERRAKVIGDTETFTAINFGRQLIFLEAIAEGRMPQSARKVWVTALDERVCKVCRPMDGVSVPMDQPFEIVLPLPKTGRGKVRPNLRLMVPPVHPNCRCTVVPQERFIRGIITRTARYKDDKHHRAELVSRVEDLVFQKVFDPNEARDKVGRWTASHRDEVGAGLVAALAVGMALTPQGRRVVAAIPKIHFSEAAVEDAAQAIQRAPKPKQGVHWRGVAAHLNDAETKDEGLRVLEEAGKEAKRWNTQFAGSGGFDSTEVFPVLSNLVYHSPKKAPELMRGFRLAPANDPMEHSAVAGKREEFIRFIKSLKPGAEFEMPLTSWTTDESIANNFSRIGRASPGTKHYRFELVGGAKAVQLAKLEDIGEQEWVTAGKFRVTGVRVKKIPDNSYLYDLDSENAITEAQKKAAKDLLKESLAKAKAEGLTKELSAANKAHWTSEEIEVEEYDYDLERPVVVIEPAKPPPTIQDMLWHAVGGHWGPIHSQLNTIWDLHSMGYDYDLVKRLSDFIAEVRELGRARQEKVAADYLKSVAKKPSTRLTIFRVEQVSVPKKYAGKAERALSDPEFHSAVNKPDPLEGIDVNKEPNWDKAYEVAHSPNGEVGKALEPVEKFLFWDPSEHPRGFGGRFTDKMYGEIHQANRFLDRHPVADKAVQGAAMVGGAALAYRVGASGVMRGLAKPRLGAEANSAAKVWTDFKFTHRNGVPALTPSKALVQHIQDTYGVGKEFAGGFKIRLGYIDMEMKRTGYTESGPQVVNEVLRAGKPNDPGVHLSSPALSRVGLDAHYRPQGEIFGEALRQGRDYLVRPNRWANDYRAKLLQDADADAKIAYQEVKDAGFSDAEARAAANKTMAQWKTDIEDEIKYMLGRHPAKVGRKEVQNILRIAHERGFRAALDETALRERVSVKHMKEVALTSDHPLIMHGRMLAPEVQAAMKNIKARKPLDRELHVFGQIMAPDGSGAGWFSAKINTKTMSVDHDGLFLRPEYRNAGFADEWLMHIIPHYMRSGIEKATIWANADVGGYAWATNFPFIRFSETGATEMRLDNRLLSYSTSTFKNGEFKRGTRQRMTAFKSMQGASKSEIRAVRRQIDGILKRLYTLDHTDPDFPTPLEIAAVGKQYTRRMKFNGKEMNLWPGKEILVGTSWKGEVADKQQVYNWLRGNGLTPEQVADLFQVKGVEALKRLGFSGD